jgi:hypothetical protein
MEEYLQSMDVINMENIQMLLDMDTIIAMDAVMKVIPDIMHD